MWPDVFRSVEVGLLLLPESRVARWKLASTSESAVSPVSELVPARQSRVLRGGDGAVAVSFSFFSEKKIFHQQVEKHHFEGFTRPNFAGIWFPLLHEGEETLLSIVSEKNRRLKFLKFENCLSLLKAI